MWIFSAREGWERLKNGRMSDLGDEEISWDGLRGTVIIVRPIRREEPKCREGMAANLLVKRLSVHIDPSPWGPWTVSTNLQNAVNIAFVLYFKEKGIPIAPS
jgi:hypothetical protein